MKYISFALLASLLLVAAAGPQALAQEPGFDPTKTLMDVPTSNQYHPSKRGKSRTHPAYREYGGAVVPLDNNPGGRDNDPDVHAPLIHPSYIRENLRIPEWIKEGNNLAQPAGFTVSLTGFGSQVGLKLKATGQISGCSEMEMLQYTTTINGIIMDIKVLGYHDPAVDPYFNPDACNLQPQRVETDIPLTRESLAGIQIIRLQSGFVMDTYRVVLGQDDLRLLPEKKKMFKPLVDAKVPDPLWRQFYPDNTVVLFSNAASGKGPSRKEIEALAASRGLKPMEEVFTSFTPPTTKRGIYYFVDGGDGVVSRLYGDRPVAIGRAVAYKKVRTQDGLVKRPGYVDVYARLPQGYE